MDSLEQNLLSSAWATHREKRAIPVQSHPHCTPSGHRAGKDIHDQKETMCARNWTYSEPSGRVALHLPFLSACVKSPCSNSPPSVSHLLSPITSQDPNFESSFPRISTKWQLGLATDWNLYKSTPCLSGTRWPTSVCMNYRLLSTQWAGPSSLSVSFSFFSESF